MTKELILAPVFTIGDLIQKDGTLALSKEAVAVKNELLAEAKPVQNLTSVKDRDHAVNVAARIKGLEDEAEGDHERAKSNFWKMCQAIDLTKKRHIEELTAERTRLNRLVGAFNEEQRLAAQREEAKRIQAALDLKRQAEEAQMELERKVEAARKEQEALTLKHKQAQEAAERKGRELTPEAKAKQLQTQLEAEERQERIEAEAKRKQEELAAQQRQLEQERMAAAERDRAAKATGGSNRFEYDITVTDIHKLYAARRDCVELKPNLVQIKYLTNHQPDLVLPGVTVAKRPVFAAKGR